LDDTYFVTLALGNYEQRAIQRPVFPGQQVLQVRPWEGTVQDRGIELTIDVNNKLALMNREGDFVVNEDTVRATIDIMRRAVEVAPEALVENASLDIDALVREEA
jgi:hypothetical protein